VRPSGTRRLLGRVVWPLQDDCAHAGRVSRQLRRTLEPGKLNVDENPKAPSQYHIRSIPTLMLFKAGQRWPPR